VVEILAVFGMGEQSLDIRRHGDEARQRTAVGYFPDRGRDSHSVHVGQAEVQQGDVVVMFLQRRQCLQAISYDIHVVATLAQQQLQKIRCDRAVLGDEHFQRTDIMRLRLRLHRVIGCHLFSVAHLW
jgi:hypothetical protein